MSIHTDKDTVAAAEIARAAGDVLLRLRDTFGDHVDGKARGKAGDAGAQAAIARMLGERFPQDAVLSEEARDSDARLRAGRVWIIDPLDGVRVPRGDGLVILLTGLSGSGK